MFLVFSCGKEKILQLPEIENAEITEVLDVSPAYIFYDETQQDSVELNRRNLIISTNWLVNVDKRLTLQQALPSIIKLQDKKRNASMHKNEAAKNYFTCNDTSIKNLGFVEFTDVIYNLKPNKTPVLDSIKPFNTNHFHIIKAEANEQHIISKIEVYFEKDRILIDNFSVENNELNKTLNTLFENEPITKLEMLINFNKQLSFQDYIAYKSLLNEIESENISISNNESIY